MTEKEKPTEDSKITENADKESTDGLEYCIQPGNPEATRSNEDEDACDPGLSGTFEEKL